MTSKYVPTLDVNTNGLYGFIPRGAGATADKKLSTLEYDALTVRGDPVSGAGNETRVSSESIDFVGKDGELKAKIVPEKIKGMNDFLDLNFPSMEWKPGTKVLGVSDNQIKEVEISGGGDSGYVSKLFDEFGEYKGTKPMKNVIYDEEGNKIRYVEGNSTQLPHFIRETEIKFDNPSQPHIHDDQYTFVSGTSYFKNDGMLIDTPAGTAIYSGLGIISGGKTILHSELDKIVNLNVRPDEYDRNETFISTSKNGGYTLMKHPDTGDNVLTKSGLQMGSVTLTSEKAKLLNDFKKIPDDTEAKYVVYSEAGSTMSFKDNILPSYLRSKSIVIEEPPGLPQTSFINIDNQGFIIADSSAPPSVAVSNETVVFNDDKSSFTIGIDGMKYVNKVDPKGTEEFPIPSFTLSLKALHEMSKSFG